MCGIAGIIDFEGHSVQNHEVKTMIDCMRHRGPDDEGLHATPEAALGVCRLSIMDIHYGRQPISNEDGTAWVVCNGEIYNAPELRRSLKSAGHTFRTSSDTEVIVHAYEEKGVDCIDDFNGMFSFAIYDSKRHAVFLVRDRMGIKPLYYHEGHNRFYFSSDLTAINRVVEAPLSRQAFFGYIGHAYIPAPLSAYEGIFAFSPGTYLWIEKNKRRMKTYWDSASFQPESISRDDAVEKLNSLLSDSVKLQLQSDVPVGIFLSGGIDSSAVTALAAQHSHRPLETFTADFLGKGGEDKMYAKTISQQYGTHHHAMPMDAELFLSVLDELITLSDKPLGDSAAVPTYAIARYARSQGVKVLLSGAGGDELFGGYRRHFRPRFGAPAWVAESLPILPRLFISKLWEALQPVRGLRAFDPTVAFAAGISGVDLGFWKNLLKERTHFVAVIGELRRSHFALIELEQRLGYSSARMRIDLQQYLCDNILALTDAATMAVSVEGRVPLLDHRLIEFVCKLPPAINLFHGAPKDLFRASLTKQLPDALLKRKKEGFNAPVTAWAKAAAMKKIQKELEDNLTPFVRELIDIRVLESTLNRPSQSSETSETLFSLYVWNRWWRRHSTIS